MINKLKVIVCIIIVYFICAPMHADVLGPYITGKDTAVDGYDRVVCVMYNTEYGSGSLTISDENGTEYTLVAHANGALHIVIS